MFFKTCFKHPLNPKGLVSGKRINRMFENIQSEEAPPQNIGLDVKILILGQAIAEICPKMFTTFAYRYNSIVAPVSIATIICDPNNY